jgi:hypothetical protein
VLHTKRLTIYFSFSDGRIDKKGFPSVRIEPVGVGLPNVYISKAKPNKTVKFDGIDIEPLLSFAPKQPERCGTSYPPTNCVTTQ